MFPDALHFNTNEEMKGRVFSFELDSMGFASPPGASTAPKGVTQTAETQIDAE